MSCICVRSRTRRRTTCTNPNVPHNVPVEVTDRNTPSVRFCSSCSTRSWCYRQDFCSSCSRARTSPCRSFVSCARGATANPTADTCDRSSSSSGTLDTLRLSTLGASRRIPSRARPSRRSPPSRSRPGARPPRRRRRRRHRLRPPHRCARPRRAPTPPTSPSPSPSTPRRRPRRRRIAIAVEFSRAPLDARASRRASRVASSPASSPAPRVATSPASSRSVSRARLARARLARLSAPSRRRGRANTLSILARNRVFATRRFVTLQSGSTPRRGFKDERPSTARFRDGDRPVTVCAYARRRADIFYIASLEVF